MTSAAASVAPGTLTPEEVAALAPDIRRIYQSPAFARLRARRGSLALKLSIAMCVIYYGFILMIAFAPQVLAIRIDEVITVGIPLGLGVILSAIVLTGIYVSRANREFDQLSADALKAAQS
ncbi:DUF485 domain-containing protein [Hydrocarboniphaga sp.]|uniref:DUF485 domain-containing protein n=1 Tax=Hydrocarboniphaga sp. TaxID=2033016 RepID=UPI003D147826